ncbi:hypothetical protein [Gordonia tangerina]|uniref:DUF2188 domain-containing protein n=1 Tax=Gordonia tangerina TaxID=2911060 RepID=A0ABS9DQ37_9ACTN|nr:hypothetical protein [Gordonia tangerina]MCF3940687.1 hypothetical protein [Gordonia tangerina]
MSDQPRLHVTQQALFSEDHGVWTARYGGEDWSVTAESKEAALDLLRETLEARLDDADYHSRRIGLGEAAALGLHAEEGFSARFINREDYEARMITMMEETLQADD